MCVICHKPENVKLPSKQTFEDMWGANRDGAGVMWRDGGKVRYVKGFMKEADFMKWLDDNREMLNDKECAFHFRITTHGGTNKENCHPFPLDLKTDPHALSGCCKSVLMHNGILPLKPRDKKYSDTVELTLRAKDSGEPEKYIDSVAEFVAQSSRLLVFTPKFTHFIGTWHKRKNDDGCTYSNLNFEAVGVSYGRGFGFGDGYGTTWWDEYDERDSVEKDGKNEPEFYWSVVRGSWVHHPTMTEVSIEEVDPNKLDANDTEEYWEQYEALYGDYGDDGDGVYCIGDDEDEKKDAKVKVEAKGGSLR